MSSQEVTAFTGNIMRPESSSHVEYGDVCDWDFNEDLEFDEVHGTTAVQEVEREEDDEEAT